MYIRVTYRYRERAPRVQINRPIRDRIVFLRQTKIAVCILMFCTHCVHGLALHY